ncbi:hypothetical protein DN752_19440 [Echinicola strongylocentroti]|uniref:Uncharacterized protein n=1 Tax=Echinicola strongylocentroti TaxID=1795355 RepID=A0A2Z4IN25_9BACT|nr:hypothetical protein DN752_19440 [Echinicola strongylocentroti]
MSIELKSLNANSDFRGKLYFIREEIENWITSKQKSSRIEGVFLILSETIRIVGLKRSNQIRYKAGNCTPWHALNMVQGFDFKNTMSFALLKIR